MNGASVETYGNIYVSFGSVAAAASDKGLYMPVCIVEIPSDRCWSQSGMALGCKTLLITEVSPRYYHHS